MNSDQERKLISVCMIVRNEEAMLPACLESVRSVATEIIVVDTGSTDSTRRIAESYGAVVIDSPWQNNFAQARNVALNHATCPWIVSIDADERITNPHVLRAVVEHASESVHGYLVDVSSVSTNPNSTTRFVSQLLRVFRNDPRIRFYGVIHEQVLECLAQNGLRFESSGVIFDHLGYDLSPDAMRAKHERNISLLNEAWKEHPDDAYVIHQRARTHLALGNLEEAERDTQIALLLAKEGGVVRPQTLNYGALIAFRQGNYLLAIERASESLRLVPLQSYPAYILGESYSELGNHAEAFRAYSDVVSAQQINDLQARIVGSLTLPEADIAYACGRSLIGMGQHKEAKNLFEIGFASNPRSTSCLIGLANCAYHDRDLSAALGYLQSAKEIEPGRTEIHRFIEQVRNAQTEEYLRSITGIDADKHEHEPSAEVLPKYYSPSIQRPRTSLQ